MVEQQTAAWVEPDALPRLSVVGIVDRDAVVVAGPDDRIALVGELLEAFGDRQIGPIRVYGTALGYPRERKDLTEDDVARTRIGWIEL